LHFETPRFAAYGERFIGHVRFGQDVTATWLMHDLGASSFSLSLMATAASVPFFLFTLPAGAGAY
jgi:hypothetical protein